MKHDYVFVQKKTYTNLFPNIYVIGRIYTFLMKDFFNGSTFGTTLLAAKDGVIYWYASESGLQDVAQKGLEMVKKDPTSARKVKEKYESMVPEIQALGEKLCQLKLDEATNKQLWDLMAEYLDVYERSYLWSEPLVLSLNDMLSPYLKAYLSGLTKKDKKTTQYYNILVSCPEKSFVKEEEDALLRLALDIKMRKIKDTDRAIREHTAQYCWVPYDYGAYSWDEKYFKTVLDKILFEDNVEELLQKSEDYFGGLRERQSAIIKELGIDDYHQALFDAMRQASYLLDYKKQIYTVLHWKSERFLREIAKRVGATKDQVQYYLPDELRQALVENKPLSAEVLQARFTDSVVVWEGEKTWFTALGEGDKFVQHYLKAGGKEEKMLGGVIASAGKYTGPVRVMQGAGELAKVKKGDVLVASMTTPEYVPAMRKAGAIITDEGGVMCHAAIVSRELGIPCVVGTKNATKILKDGDIVEVNANHNSVRINHVEQH